MEKGKWNYTEDMEYHVIYVELKPVEKPKMHWQNAFVGEIHQAVEIIYPNGYKFLIDNQDGSGLLKIQRGGGPDSGHSSIDYDDCIIVSKVPKYEWIQFDKDAHFEHQMKVNKWQKETYPEEYERIESLRKLIGKSHMNRPRGISIKNEPSFVASKKKITKEKPISLRGSNITPPKKKRK